MLAVRVALVAVLAAVLLAACGGDDAPRTVANVTVTASPAADELHAAAIMPTLDDIGFKLISQGKPPASTNFQDVALAQYEKRDAPAMNARVEISVLPDVATATKQFGILSDALRNPPPGLFGGPDTVQKDAPRSGPGDEGRSYVTDKPDGQGNLVYSDSYRFGRTFAIVYLVSGDEAQALTARKAIAEHIEANTK